VASSFLRTLGGALEDGTLGTSAYVGDAVFDLVAAVVAERLDVDGIPPDGSRTAMLARIDTYIDAHLGERDLTVSRIAASHHVSVRYLQKLFEDHDRTVTGWIRHRRLDKARRDLGDRSLAGRQVSTIGARWGFADAGVFSRSFRAEFGVPPREYRAQSLDR
jgi:AraC-like DNA-binding protein